MVTRGSTHVVFDLRKHVKLKIHDMDLNVLWSCPAISELVVGEEGKYLLCWDFPCPNLHHYVLPLKMSKVRNKAGMSAFLNKLLKSEIFGIA